MVLLTLKQGITSLTGLAGLRLVQPVSVLKPQIATIVSKALRESTYRRPNPFPYTTTEYGFLKSFMDKTTYRFDENSKVIVVDGPIAAGKTKLAKKLANDLDMLYVSEGSMDYMYINSYGYDMRQLDPQLPVKARSFDVNNFLQNPKHFHVALLQLNMMSIRLSQYIDALAHVLSTGQGVVMDRSVYSDLVFLETNYKFNYISKGARRYYYEAKKMVVPELLRPHLVIYLDVPVLKVLENIKARNLPSEVNSPVYTAEYLTYMETVYKKQYLKQMSVNSEILVYDWSEEGEPEVVVEDIERINFDNFEKHDPKCIDWRLPDEWSWCNQRQMYTVYKDNIMNWLDVPEFNVPEILLGSADNNEWQKVWYNAPGMKYDQGFNADVGDAYILTKTKSDVVNSY